MTDPKKFKTVPSESLLDPNDAVVVIAAMVHQLGDSFTLCRESILQVIDGPVPYIIYISDIEGDKIIRIEKKEIEK